MEAQGGGPVHPRTGIGGGAHSQRPQGRGEMGGAEGAKRLSPPALCPPLRHLAQPWENGARSEKMVLEKAV